MKQGILAPQGDNKPLVADQKLAHEVFSDLASKVQRQASIMNRALQAGQKTEIDTTLPTYETLKPITYEFEQPTIHPSNLGPYRRVKVTKEDQYRSHCAEAAVQILEPEVCKALKVSGQKIVFDALRAPVSISFCFEPIVEAIWGQDPSNFSQLRSSAQAPRLEQLHKLQQAFYNYYLYPTCAAVVAILLSATECKSKSYWPIGCIVFLGAARKPVVAYIGDERPKLIFLVKCLQPDHPEMFVASATAYEKTFLLGDTLPIFSKFWPCRSSQNCGSFCIEYRDGHWITNVWGYHCMQSCCHVSLLVKIGQMSICPWHRTTGPGVEELDPSVCHFFCSSDPSTSVVTVVGHLEDTGDSFVFGMFHVCTDDQFNSLGVRLHRLSTPIEAFMSTLSENLISAENLSAIATPFQKAELPNDMYKHFFFQAGGPCCMVEQWLQKRSLN